MVNLMSSTNRRQLVGGSKAPSANSNLKFNSLIIYSIVREKSHSGATTHVSGTIGLNFEDSYSKTMLLLHNLSNTDPSRLGYCLALLLAINLNCILHLQCAASLESDSAHHNRKQPVHLWALQIHDTVNTAHVVDYEDTLFYVLFY